MILDLTFALALAAAPAEDAPIAAGPLAEPVAAPPALPATAQPAVSGAAPAAVADPTAPPPAVAPPPPAAASVHPPPPAAPSAGQPSSYASPRSGRQIDDLTRPLTGGVPQGRYEAGVAGAFAASENLQGSLDGAWFVSAADGRRLYRFQFEDPGYRGGRIEGAWRDLRAGAGVVEAGGFFAGVTREGQKVVIRLAPAAGQTAVLTLEPRAGGGYGGQLANGPQILAVVMARP